METIEVPEDLALYITALAEQKGRTVADELWAQLTRPGCDLDRRCTCVECV